MKSKLLAKLVKTMNKSIYDYLSDLRDLVNIYEELIDKLKYVKNAARSDPEKINRIVLEVKKVVDKTTSILNEYNDVVSINIDDIDNNTQQYLRTYYNYLKLVSIPYARDLLKEIKQILIKYNYFEKASEIDVFLEKLMRLA